MCNCLLNQLRDFLNQLFICTGFYNYLLKHHYWYIYFFTWMELLFGIASFHPELIVVFFYSMYASKDFSQSLFTWECFYLALILKDSFAGHRILIRQFFPFSILNMSPSTFCSPLLLMRSQLFILLWFPLQDNLFSLAAFKSFSLSFNSFTMFPCCTTLCLSYLDFIDHLDV